MPHGTLAPTFLSEVELDRKLKVWQAQLDVSDDAPLEMYAPALLVLDMQNDFLANDGQLPVWGGPAIISRVAALAGAFRTAGLPVLFTRHICIEPFAHAETIGVMKFLRDPANFLREGHRGADFHPAVHPVDGEHVITKYRYSAFFDTPLGTLLDVMKVREVVITGVATNICCETTAHDAFFRGFDVIFTMDGTGGVDEGSHLASLRTIQAAYGRLATSAQVREAAKRFGRSKHGLKKGRMP